LGGKHFYDDEEVKETVKNPIQERELLLHTKVDNTPTEVHRFEQEK